MYNNCPYSLHPEDDLIKDRKLGNNVIFDHKLYFFNIFIKFTDDS